MIRGERQLIRQDLERDPAVESCLLRQINHTHPAPAELTQYGELAQLHPSTESRGLCRVQRRELVPQFRAQVDETWCNDFSAGIDPRACCRNITVTRIDRSDQSTANQQTRRPVDAFFDRVTVNTEDPNFRENRLRLLNMIRAVTQEVADFSRIEG